MHFDLFKLRQSNQSIKKLTIFFIKPMVLSNFKLHLTNARSSTSSGFNLTLLGVTTLPATEKTRSDLDEATGTGKTGTVLARTGNWDSWIVMLPPFQLVHGARQATVGKASFFTPKGTSDFFSSSSFTMPRTPSCGMLEGGFSRLWGSLGKPWWPGLNMRWKIFISKWWFAGVTIGWVVFAQKTLCNGTIKIVF